MDRAFRRVRAGALGLALAAATAVPAHGVAGDLDATFDSDGFVVTSIGALDDLANAMTLQGDGKTILAGEATVGGSKDIGIVRYNLDGTLDSTFDGDGRVITSLSAGNDRAFAVLVQPDGKVVIAGVATPAGVDVAVVRYNADGSLDATFDGDGVVITPVGTGADWAQAIARQPDGKLVVAGYSSTPSGFVYMALRYNADGSLDATFDGDGRIVTPIGSGAGFAHSVAIQADGKIVLAGETMVGTAQDVALIRYNADGSLDTTFGIGGKVTTPIGPSHDYAEDVLVQPNGKIVVGGYANAAAGSNSATLLRYNPDGSLDPTFDGDGITILDLSPGNDGIGGITRLADGRVVATGNAGNAIATVRINPSGELDTTFGAAGLVLTSIPGATSAFAVNASVLPDGRTVVGGSVFASGYWDFVAVRYQAASLASLVTVEPKRVLDTRDQAKPVAGSTTRVVTGAPAGSVAVLMNLTMTRAAAAGYITADRCTTLPAGPQTKSNANYAPGVDIANSSVVNLDADGAFCIYADQPVDLLADVQGFYGSTGLDLTTQDPHRALDTRQGPKPPAGSITRVATGAPAGSVAALVNLTMTAASAAGYVTADRCSALVAGPQAKSNANFTPASDIANSSVVNLDADGSFCIYTHQPVHLLVDVQGTFRAGVGTKLTLSVPRRVTDSRQGPKPTAGSITRVASGAPPGSKAVLVNLTMTRATAAGYVTADRCSALVAGPQAKSNANFAPGVDIANNSVVNVDADGSFCIYADQPVDLLADVQGVY